MASRLGIAQARVATMLLLTLRGTPIWYYGDEIGMVDVHIPPELVRDPQAVNQPELEGVGRDPQRTPMQWDDSPNAGFCPPNVTPWLPLGDDYPCINVLAEESDPRSQLWLFRLLADLRRKSPALLGGAYRSTDSGAVDVFAYVRESSEQRLLIVLNFGAAPQMLDLSAIAAAGSVLLDTGLARQGDMHFLHKLPVGPNEGLILAIDA